MKTLKALLVLVVALAATVLPASAQFRIGPRAGVAVNSMRLDTDVFNNENRAGFAGGLQAEFTVPVLNLGFDISVMYVHRVNSSEAKATTSADNELLLGSDNYKARDYIEIPVNFKYKLGLPLIGNIVTPYVFTGPSFAFLTSKKAITEAYKNKSVDVAWNFGVGLQLFSHLQVGASYGLGLTNTIDKLNIPTGTNAAPIEGKNNYWTITAAWLF